jgi:hypothetical protein
MTALLELSPDEAAAAVPQNNKQQSLYTLAVGLVVPARYFEVADGAFKQSAKPAADALTSRTASDFVGPQNHCDGWSATTPGC